jgi:hypothetical protein
MSGNQFVFSGYCDATGRRCGGFVPGAVVELLNVEGEDAFLAAPVTLEGSLMRDRAELVFKEELLPLRFAQFRWERARRRASRTELEPGFL